MSDVNKTQTGTVTLSNGVAEVRYKIQSPKINMSARLACVVNDPMNLRKDDVVDLSKLPSGRPIDDVPLVYTIDASKSGNVVTFTVKSNSTTNTTPVAITITEYRPGNPIGVIKTQEATVAMSNGTGTTTYTITQTQPSVDQKVEGKLTNTPSVRTEVTVPKYVAPRLNPTYDIERGMAWEVVVGNQTGICPGATLIFKATNKDYRNKPVTFRLYWRAIYTVNGGIWDSGSIDLNGTSNSKGEVRFTVTIPSKSQMKNIDFDKAMLHCDFEVTGTGELNPPYEGSLYNYQRWATQGGLRFTTTPVIHRGATYRSLYKTPNHPSNTGLMSEDWLDYDLAGKPKTGYPYGWDN